MIRRIALVALALGLVLLASARAADPVAAPRDGAAVQNILFLGESRPVLIRLHVYVDGKPVAEAWNAFIKDMHKGLDKDGDGTLSKEEAEKVIPATTLLSGAFSQGGASTVPLRSLDRNPVDGQISVAELNDYYRQTTGPFQLQYTQGTTSQAGVNDQLIKKLDANGDGQLSREELERAPESLLKLDLDDDEVVALPELDPSQASATGVVVEGGRPMTRPATDRAFILIDPDEDPRVWRNDVLDKYSKSEKKLKDTTLSKEDGVLDDATFAELDADKDGYLDRDELEKFPKRQTPDVELVVRFGTRNAGEQVLEVLNRKDRPAPLNAKITHGRGDALLLDAGNSVVDLRANDLGVQQAKANVQFTRQLYIQQFNMADADGNGYLEMAEVAMNPLLMRGFEAMDGDRDGKLFEKEMLAYLERTLDLQARATTSRGMLSIADQGKGLFDLLDANHDSRLTLRELRNAATLVAAIDRDKDGQIKTTEIPRTFQASLSREPPSGGIRRRVIVAGGGGGQPVQPESTRGPLWFRKMDRNRDGDVSQREFLGPIDEFKRIDADNDGLIAADEAEKADARLRKANGGG